MKRSLRPPLGPRPKFVWQWERIVELREYMCRAIESNWPIDVEIVNEYNELTGYIPKEKNTL
jgi:hypothetical protein